MEKTGDYKCLAAVRIRGTIKASKKVRETLQMLNLVRTNQAVLLDNRPSFLGMLKKAQNYVTWGEVSKEIVKTMLEKRGRLTGDKSLTVEYTQKLGCKSFAELAEAIFKGRLQYRDLPNVKPFFRLHPPS